MDKTQQGVAADLDRAHLPIGLDVRADTLEEVAVSILAKVVDVYRADAVR
jgi:xanthine/CO dehydrogenase XdhC/CoxF family maturation factor